MHGQTITRPYFSNSYWGGGEKVFNRNEDGCVEILDVVKLMPGLKKLISKVRLVELDCIKRSSPLEIAYHKIQIKHIDKVAIDHMELILSSIINAPGTQIPISYVLSVSEIELKESVGSLNIEYKYVFNHAFAIILGML